MFEMTNVVQTQSDDPGSTFMRTYNLRTFPLLIFHIVSRVVQPTRIRNMAVDLFIRVSSFLSKVYACDSGVHSAMKGHFPVTRQRERTDPDPTARMRILGLLLVLFHGSCAEILERPIAIIPWSQYQERLRQQKAQSLAEPQSESEPRNVYYVQRVSDHPSPRRFSNHNQDISKVDGPHPPPRRNPVIRPQIRGRVPTEPADFARQLPQLPAPQKPMFVTQPGGTHIQYPPAPPAGNSQGFRIAAAPSSRRASAPRTPVLDREPPMDNGIRMKITPSVSESSWQGQQRQNPTFTEAARPGQISESANIETPPMTSLTAPRTSAHHHGSLGDIQIPNGVPMHPATWENGQANYVTDRRPAQHAVSNVAGIDPALPLAGLRAASGFVDPSSQFNVAQLASSQLGIPEVATNQLGAAPGNIVNSIFAQSNAQGIQSIPSIARQPTVIENFLANSGNLDTISKITKNILNAGGDQGREAGILDIMANALRRTNLPFGSAVHDESPPTLEANAPPKATLMERLINQATSALNSSIKENERKEQENKRKEALKKIEEAQHGVTAVEPKTTAAPELSAEKKSSIKLLENVPADQRSILEAAIRSGEIDEASAAAAIGALVSGDTKEESRKEKESRLMEWIRANRPKKQQQSMNVTTDKLPYYGRYCGTFIHEKVTNPRVDASGGVWMADDRHLVVSRFFFKPESLLNDNVTFWFGPKEPTSNLLMDQLPSRNGFYVHPQTIDVSVFALEKLPPIKAVPRKRIPAEILLNGTSPVDVLKISKPESILRTRRDAIGAQNDEMIPTYVPAPVKKPVELLVKDGIVRIMDGDRIEQMNSSYQIALPNRTVDLGKGEIIPEVPFGAQLRQPEFDNIDYSRPQPLGWYAGFQPLLLTLPPGRKMSELKWVSLRDHTREETVVSLMIPNDPHFSPPAPVTVKPLSSNGLFNASSGPIHIHNMKTIEITNFTLRTNGDSVWFMFGKDILPNISGHIVPLYDSSTGAFDCESLRDYYGETVFLRIPGQLDMRDVFWFSVFSPSKGVSYSHLYLPYDHLRLPPDLKGTATATCEYSP